VNFFKSKILFRCDAANIPAIGTGHVFRSLTIAKLLKNKFKLKNRDIVFLVRSKNKFAKALDILKYSKFKVVRINKSNLRINSTEEAKYLQKNSANLLILDRLGKIKKNFILKIQSSFKKKMIIDDSSMNRKLFDISLNPLIHNVKKLKNSYIGFSYNILPTFFSKINLIKESNIFIFFGGYDKNNLTNKILKFLNYRKVKLNFYLPEMIKKKINKKISNNKIFYFKNNQYLSALNKCDISITAGGLGLLDSIFMKKKVICIPRYNHQLKNAKKIASKSEINLLKVDDKDLEIKFKKIFKRIYKNKVYQKKIAKAYNTILSKSKMNKTVKLIYNVYEQSIN